LGGSITDLSVADNCLFGTAMEPVLPQIPMRGWSILLTSEKLNEAAARNHSSVHFCQWK
jgi:hypothetical protein